MTFCRKTSLQPSIDHFGQLDQMLFYALFVYSMQQL